MYIHFFNTTFLLLSFSLVCCPIVSHATSHYNESAENYFTQKTVQDIEPFTGKITRNKVRMRLQPSLEAPILSEFAKDDLLNVVGESGDFYVILPPKDTRAYIFRTFVLDGTVEGNRVNVRLEPALEAPVIAQLNSGDRIEGVVSPLSSKWLEIAPPASTRFYVCKEYVEKIGNALLMKQIEKRRIESSVLLNSAQQNSEIELQKNYQDINLEGVIIDLNTLIKEYTDFPKYVERAKTLLSIIQESYLQKKIAYLEAKAFAIESQTSDAKPVTSETESIKKQDPLPRDDSFNQTPRKAASNWETPFDPNKMTPRMALWIPQERSLYEAWTLTHKNGTPKDFYEEQFGDTVELKGIVEAYSRPIKIKPGDYLLVNSLTNLPIAYLYSTQVDLLKNSGKEVLVHAVRRPNYNFAFPAYYVISIE